MIWFLPALLAGRPKTAVQRLIMRRRSFLEVMIRIGARRVWSVWLASLVIWLIAMPLVMNRFHVISPSALVLNLFLSIPLAIALLFGFGILVFGWICEPVAELCGEFCGTSLGWMEACVQFAEPQPGSHFWVAGPSVGLVVGFYAILIMGIAIKSNPKMCLTWAAIAYSFFPVRVMRWNSWARFRCWRVQHHKCAVRSSRSVMVDGVVLEFPDESVWLYDAGSLGSTTSSTEKISRFCGLAESNN